MTYNLHKLAKPPSIMSNKTCSNTTPTAIDGSFRSVLQLLDSLGYITPQPWKQSHTLVGTGYTGDYNNIRQGRSVSISKDGTTIAVGGDLDNNDTGATWIFVKNGDVWEQQGNKLVGTGAVGNAYQGYSVSLSADGNTLAVGGREDNSRVGATWIFTRTGTTWSQQGNKLVGTGNVGDSEQGYSVSLSGDGNTLVVGGHGDNSYVGATWIFTRSGTVWSQVGSKLVGTGYTNQSEQGYSVSISRDGSTIAVGGYADDNYTGGTWIFIYDSGNWVQQGSVLKVTDGISSPHQGSAVSLSADGNTLAIGAKNDNDLGATWIFTRTGTTWVQGSKLVGTGYNGDSNQGYAVALDDDGDTLVVGGYRDHGYSYEGDDIGAVWLFTKLGTVWTQQGYKYIPNDYATNDDVDFGSSVSITADGKTFAAGGPDNNNDVGAVWIFEEK